MIQWLTTLFFIGLVFVVSLAVIEVFDWIERAFITKKCKDCGTPILGKFCDRCLMERID